MKLYNGGPIPAGYALVCPHCEEYKMERVPKKAWFRCLGPNCGKLVSNLQVEQSKVQYMVEE